MLKFQSIKTLFSLQKYNTLQSREGYFHISSNIQFLAFVMLKNNVLFCCKYVGTFYSIQYHQLN